LENNQNQRIMRPLKKHILILTIFATCALSLVAQNIPEKPNPPRLVNDFAGVLDANLVMNLENELVQFSEQTSSQIAIVTVPTLDGADVGQYAFQLGEKWGIGQKGKNNGILILLKPKTGDERGQVFIATGYGLEGAVPDGIASQIVNNEMIPQFKNGDYGAGILAAVKVIEELTRGEYTADDYQKRHQGGSGLIGLLLIVVIIGVIVMISRSGGTKSYSRTGAAGSSLPFWMLMGGMAASRNNHGSWNNFSGGGSGGGGFGGFGGGSFGGGGAGGSW